MQSAGALAGGVCSLHRPVAGEHAGESNPLVRAAQGSWEAAMSTLLAEASKC